MSSSETATRPTGTASLGYFPRSDFCVYEHWRPDKGCCFYVGKGSIKRARFFTRKENQRHLRIVEKLKRLGLQVDVRVIARDLTEPAAFELEKIRIAYWRQSNPGEVVNLTDGGEGSSGMKMSPETRVRQSIAKKGKPLLKSRGRKLSSEHREAISKGSAGRVVTAETRAKISAAQKGKPRPALIGRKFSESGIQRLKARVFTAEHRAKISAAKRGKPKSEEHKRKLAEASKNHRHGPEALAKIRAAAAARRGIPRSDETKRKISDANKGRPGKKGGIPWCKGRHLSETTKLKMSAARKGQKRGPMPLVQREKLRQSLLGRPNRALKGKPLAPEHRQKLIDAWARRKASAVSVDEQAPC